jgi:GNAT superfamily N-acetyltransferase
VPERVKRNALLDLRRLDRRFSISSPESVGPERLLPLLYGRSKNPVAFSVVRAGSETDFVHSIVGRIFAKVEGDAEEKEAGCVKASLVQFGEAMDHGITTERLGDGVDGNIAEYWELLFDLDSGDWREEIRDEYEALGCDLLIIDCVEVHPKLRGRGIGRSVVHRTIDIFGAGCGLVACRPWPLQFTPAYTRDRKALKRLQAPSVGRDDAIHKLRAYWSRLGFWPLGGSGIYLLSMTQRGSGEAPKKCETFAAPRSGLTSRRLC